MREKNSARSVGRAPVARCCVAHSKFPSRACWELGRACLSNPCGLAFHLRKLRTALDAYAHVRRAFLDLPSMHSGLDVPTGRNSLGMRPSPLRAAVGVICARPPTWASPVFRTRRVSHVRMASFNSADIGSPDRDNQSERACDRTQGPRAHTEA